MPTRLTEGKAAGLMAVANEHGVIAAIAMDQRGVLKKMLAKELGVSDPPGEKVSQFKELVTAALTKYASAILLDVEHGLSAMKYRNNKGVLLAYEKSNYDVTAPEFLPSVTEGWSVLRLKEAGAAAVKILIYYSPFENPWVNEQKQAWVERVGAECQAYDMPLFLELLSYDVHGEEGLAKAKRKPEGVIHSMEEFSKERYGADALKVEVPVEMTFVHGTRSFQGEQAYSRVEAMEYFRRAAAVTSKPFVYLSAGVSNQAFIETLEFAIESGVRFHGVLCGRAVWQDGVPVFVKHGAQALEEWLNTKGTENVMNVNRVLEATSPWHEKYDIKMPHLSLSGAGATSRQ